ncbi:MAG TPA: protein kinase [Gemmatimonadaceae bacterium]|nr:protein kinase [Gemmatimonadaceae bacterium]
MSDARWHRLEELFHQALERPPKERASFLDRECAEDLALRADVERLLSANARAGDFIEAPAIATPSAAPPDEGDDPQAGRRIGAYRIVRALGRGGMGAVYLAERDDGAFLQRVAIKLIKRGMDTDQVLLRFRAERQILASLDHPNIARLLDGGTTDDGLPYFAMEFIDGQAIDTFAETKRLGVEDRLRLFLHVCDAVAYAHHNGVIHRDIKPLNTLVTPAGVPKLLDFGIAKVLHDTPDENTATITGLRLLTPDYASPEQVEGRRATVASDVYSLGVVLFELLTGRSPYRVSSRSPQEIAAAVVTTEPDRPSTVVTHPSDRVKVRRTLPTTGSHASADTGARHLSRRLRGDLDTIVLTALRKDPDRRYASVASMADDIRRHLEARPITARADHTAYRVAKFLRRQRAALVTAAVALVAVVSSAVLLARSGRNDPTLISTNTLHLRDRVVVADFADLTGDAALGRAITEAVRTDLSQSPVIRVMTPRQVRSSLATMQQSPDVALNDSLARELAVREGVKAIVTGSLSRLSGSYTITVQLLAAQSGEALASLRETARDSTQLIRAVDRASKQLRQRIGESLRDLADTPRLWQATTASLPALRLFTEAQQLVRSGDRTAAVEKFERSIALDTGFASAELGLSMAYGSMGDEGRSMAASERALAHQERLPFVERSFLLASRAYSRHDYETAIRAYTAVVDRYPENISALNNVALAYRDSRRFATAESLFVRAIAIDSSVANLLFGLHTTQVLQGKFGDATNTLDTIRRRFPDHPVYLTEYLQDAAAQQDWPRAERTALTQIEKVGTDTAQLVDPYEALAQIAMVRGRLRESERLWATHARVSRASGIMGRHLFGVLQRGYLELRYRNDTARAIALVDSALHVMPLDGLLPADRRYDEVARFYIAAGQPARVAPLLDAAQANDRALRRSQPEERLWTRGLLALAEGRVASAVDTLRLASSLHMCASCVLPDLGHAYERSHRLREAADAYRTYLSTPWLWRYEPDAVALGWTLKRLSAVSEQLGDTNQARASREQLLHTWQGADASLQVVLDSIRAADRQRSTR